MNAKKNRNNRTTNRCKAINVSMEKEYIERYQAWRVEDPSIPDLSAIFSPTHRLIEMLVEEKMVLNPLVLALDGGRYLCLTFFATVMGMPTFICTTFQGTESEAKKKHTVEVARNFFKLGEDNKLRITVS